MIKYPGDILYKFDYASILKLIFTMHYIHKQSYLYLFQT